MIENKEKNKLLIMNNIVKKFPGTVACDNINLHLYSGEVLALVGNNGAGKSTLIKCLVGVHEIDKGTIIVDNAKVVSLNRKSEQLKKIGIVFQELSLFPNLSAMENIFIGNIPSNKKMFGVNYKIMEKKCKELFDKLSIKVDPREKIKNIEVGLQQMVEIAKGVSQDIKILILDEPTSALSSNEITPFFSFIRMLKNRGIGIIYITHRLDEVFTIADRVQVLRDGKSVNISKIKNTSKEKVIKYMTGKNLFFKKEITKTVSNEKIVEIKNLSVPNYFEKLNFSINKGEILGIAGVLGSGRTQILKSIMGLEEYTGDIYFKDRKIDNLSSLKRKELGICYIPEDRKNEGVFPQKTLEFNLVISRINKLTSFNAVNTRMVNQLVNKLIKDLDIEPPNPQKVVRLLSGGNQQKAVVGRSIAVEPELLLMDEPTRGVDVGAKEDLYKLVQRLSKQGLSIIFVSLELEELIKICHRIMVLRNGEIQKKYIDTANLNVEDLTHEVTLTNN